jgi:type I restriction enzyme S subunit
MAGEWKELSLREAGVQLLDCDHKTPAAIADGYPYIAIPQLKNGRIDLTDARRISRDDYLAWTRKTKPQVWDVIVSRRCNPGETAVVPPDLECALGQNLVILRSTGSCVFPPFLRWLLRSPAWWDQVRTFINVGAVFESLKCADIPNFRLPIPPLPEQQAIACILGALDDKIELNRRQNRTLEAMARAIFQSWFVDFDPVRAKAAGRAPAGMSKGLAALFPASFEESALGPIPKGWKACRWGDIATLEYGKSLRDYAEASGPYRVFGTNGPIGWHTETLCDGPGVVIGRKGAYRGIHYSPKPFFVIDTAFYLKPKASIDLKWAYYELLKCDINGMDSGSAIPSTSRADFYAIPVCLPSPDVLRAFGKLTQPIYDRRDANENENNTLAALRDALLPKLVSGELRVPDAERIVGRAM